MADGYSVEVKGFPQLAAGTAELADKIAKGSRESFGRVADQVASATRGRLHRDTGATVASVRTRQLADGATVGYGEGVPYAQYQEYGGRGFPHSSDGNFLGASVRDAPAQLQHAAEQTADHEIGAMRWPTP